MNLPKITVVTPSYNQGQFLEQTVKSVLEQDYPDLEYIIMDGGSTDNSVEIIKQYEPRLAYWQSRPDGGQSAAINAGFKRATGEILCWLNSDDQLLPGTLKTIGQYFCDHPECEWVSGDMELRYIAEGKTFISKAYMNSNWSIVNFWVLGSKGCFFSPQPSTFWRKSLWDRAGGHVREDKPNSMDYVLWLRFCDSAELAIIPRALSAAAMHGECKSMKNNYLQRLETIQSIYEFAHRHGSPLRRRLLLTYERRQLFMALHCLRVFAIRELFSRLFKLLCGPFLLWSIKGNEKMWTTF